MNLYDSIGMLGVVLCLLAFLLLQINRLSLKKPLYSLLNLIGALCILSSLYVAFNLAAFVMEVSWGLISLYGLYQAVDSKLHAQDE